MNIEEDMRKGVRRVMGREVKSLKPFKSAIPFVVTAAICAILYIYAAVIDNSTLAMFCLVTVWIAGVNANWTGVYEYARGYEDGRKKSNEES